jgi:hypothetical protein
METPIDTDISLEQIEENIKHEVKLRAITIRAKEDLLSQIFKQRAKIRKNEIDEDSGNSLINSLIKNWMQWHEKTIRYDLEISRLEKDKEIMEKWIAG